jgi:hypothetical protein
VSARTVWGLRRADGRGRVVHIATSPQDRCEGWESRAATTRCGQSGIWVQGDDMDGPPCAACNRAPTDAATGGR